MGRDIDLECAAAAKVEPALRRETSGEIEANREAVLRQNLLEKSIATAAGDDEPPFLQFELAKQVRRLLGIEKQTTGARHCSHFDARAVSRTDEHDRLALGICELNACRQPARGSGRRSRIAEAHDDVEPFVRAHFHADATLQIKAAVEHE